MNTTTAPRILQHTPIVPIERTNAAGENPNTTRYGFCAFKDINLGGGLGTFDYQIQPENSPYLREMPKNQLIPFETFTIESRSPDPNAKEMPGSLAPMITDQRLKSALEAAVELGNAYGEWGYTILTALEGLAQEDAFRIFSVVMPFDYKLGDLVNELAFGSEARISSTVPIVFNLGGEIYTVENLRSETERGIARRLLAEMLAAAQKSATYADQQISKTVQEMTTRFAGGKEGKTTPDALDRYLADELGEKLPELVSNKSNGLEQKLDYLITRDVERTQAEEIEQLRRENAALKAGAPAEQSAIGADLQARAVKFATGDTVIVNGREAAVLTVLFGRNAGKYRVSFVDDGEEATFNGEELSK